MKKIFLLLGICTLALTSCTEQSRAKNYGGTANINLEQGQRLINATWKGDDLWYLTEQMDSTYVPKTKYFQESSSWGVHEGTIIFKETK